MKIELVAPAIEAYKMPQPPEAVWYISADIARLELAYPMQALTENPKTMVDIDWLPNGALLVIVWAAQTPEKLVELIADVAGDCALNTNIKIDL